MSENAPIADIGAQYDVGAITLGASLRNVGGNMSGHAPDPLPTEARLGAFVPLATAQGLAVTAFVDAIARVRESSYGFSAGIEAGVLPQTPAGIGAVARVGFDSDANQLASLRFCG